MKVGVIWIDSVVIGGVDTEEIENAKHTAGLQIADAWAVATLNEHSIGTECWKGSDAVQQTDSPTMLLDSVCQSIVLAAHPALHEAQIADQDLTRKPECRSWKNDQAIGVLRELAKLLRGSLNELAEIQPTCARLDLPLAASFCIDLTCRHFLIAPEAPSHFTTA